MKGISIYKPIVSFTKNIVLVLLCTLQVNVLWAQIPKSDLPPAPNPPRLVNDLAGVMDASVIQELEKELVAFDNTQSTQIAVVTVKSIGSYEIAQYGTELAHHWGIGRKGKDNGVLLLVAVNDRKVNISTGYGTEGAITDGTAGTIIRQEITPAFKNGDYNGGIVAGARAIKAALNGEYVNDQVNNTEEGVGIPMIVLLFITIFVIIVIIGASGRGGGGGGKGGRSGEYMSRRGDDFLTGAILGSLLNGGRSGGFGGGFGGGSSGGFGGGGGFGGFGGGGFGGGGASGSW